MSDLDTIFTTLLDKGYAEELFGAARPDGRNNRKADCPLCGGHNLSYSLTTPQWHCFNCKAGGNWITYLKATRGLTGAAAARELATAAGVEWKPSAAESRRVELGAVREAYWKLCIIEAAKRGERARAVFNHLVQRGYTPDNMPASASTLKSIAVAPDPDTARDGLLAAGFDLKQIKAAGLMYDGGKIAGWGGYQMVMRWEQGGLLDGFIWRDVWGTANAKYLYSAGLARNEGLVGLAAAGQLIRKAAATGRRVGLLLVEGVLDAVCLNAEGIPTAALGGIDLSETQIGKMKAAGVPFVYLALDADKVGQANILKITRALQRHKIEAYIWQVPDYQGCKDSEELFLKHGAAAIGAANRRALPAGHWVAVHTVEQHPDAATDPQAERELLWAARVALGGLRLAEDRAAFLSEIARLTQIEPAHITAGIAELDAVVARQEQAATAAGALTAAMAALEEGASPDTIKRAADAVGAAMAALTAGGAVELPPRYDMGQWISDLAAKPDGLPVFWSNSLAIPTGATTIISGGTGGGKTTLMLNLLWRWLEDTPDRYIFLSYEERREDLLLKLVMVGAGAVVDERDPQRNTQRVREYIVSGGEAVATTTDVMTRLDGALDKLDRWLTDGRLDVVDVPYKAEQLPALAASLKARPPRAILLDYIQKIPTDGRGAVRYLDLQAISATLLSVAVEHNFALVIGSQINADGLVREARDISFDASLVVKIKPVEVEKGQAEPPDTATPIKVFIEKNRQGRIGEHVILWNKPARRMEKMLYDVSKNAAGLQ